MAALEVADLTDHYTRGLEVFHREVVPAVKERLAALSGGAWSFEDYDAVAAGSDCDFVTHLVEAVSSRGPVRLYPGDWHGFRVGGTHDENVAWSDRADSALGCLCIPSVRNGHLTSEQLDFLETADACLLNLNLYPTLRPAERRAVAAALEPLLPRSVLSISFSRGFGLTASQLGVALVHRDHRYRTRFARQWDWHTYFYNALAARAFLAIDPDELAREDARRRAAVGGWLSARGLPSIETGSYYVRSFRPDGVLADHLAPLVRGDVVRLCFKAQMFAVEPQ